MKRASLVFASLLIALLMPVAYANSSHHASSPRSSGGYRSSTRSSPVPRSSAGRPYYGGGHHTTSHGGNYPGETNEHHKNGHYWNWKSANRYGVHQ